LHAEAFAHTPPRRLLIAARFDDLLSCKPERESTRGRVCRARPSLARHAARCARNRRESAVDQQQAPDWRRKISDHIAYALLVYTSFQIFLTMTALRLSAGSLLPYLALVVLVAVIPACRRVERRWPA
jgi:hypothetical protein